MPWWGRGFTKYHIHPKVRGTANRLTPNSLCGRALNRSGANAEMYGYQTRRRYRMLSPEDVQEVGAMGPTDGRPVFCAKHICKSCMQSYLKNKDDGGWLEVDA